MGCCCSSVRAHHELTLSLLRPLFHSAAPQAHPAGTGALASSFPGAELCPCWVSSHSCRGSLRGPSEFQPCCSVHGMLLLALHICKFDESVVSPPLGDCQGQSPVYLFRTSTDCVTLQSLTSEPDYPARFLPFLLSIHPGCNIQTGIVEYCECVKS